MPSNAAKGNRLTCSVQEVVISGVLLKFLFLSGSTFVSDKEMLRKVLKNNSQYGSCCLVSERETLFDKAKIWYSDNRGIHPVLATSTLPVPAEEIKPKGWARKVTKKATRFNEKQTKKVPWRKVFLGSGDGHKSRSNYCSTKDEALKRWGQN